MQEWLTHIFTYHQYLVYGVIILVSFVEGPILAILSGILIHVAHFSFWPLYLALMFGDLIGDVVWYWIGRRFGHRFIARFGKYFSVTEEGVASVTKIFHQYKHRILIISKITMGFGFALVTLITAGMARIPFKHYLAMNVIGQFVWTGILISVGYLFGNLYVQFDNVFGKISIIALVILLMVALVGYGKYVRSRMSETKP